MKHRNIDMPWRPAYEFYSALGWLVALVFLFVSSISVGLPIGPFWYMAAVAIIFILLNVTSAWRIWSIKFALSGYGVAFLTLEKLQAIVDKRPDRVWLGSGFDWTNEHTQRIYDLKRHNPTDYYPPELFLKIKEKLTGQKIASLDADSIGAPWIHGVEPNETDVDMFIDNLIGNTLIVGTTRCGKTRMLDVLQAQFVFRKNACVIIIDPKGDKELRQNMYKAAVVAGREKDFRTFHLAFPSTSIRIDPLKNYNNLSELATRVSGLVQTDSGSGDAFTAFAWDVSNAIFMGLSEVGEKHTLLKLRQYVESGVEPLLTRCFPSFFAKNASKIPDWEKKAREYVSRAVKKNADGSMPARDANAKEVVLGLTNMYESIYKTAGIRSEAIDALSNIQKHDVTHYGKMLANFKPMLAMLTTGEIGGLLSPDVSDIEDDRLATDMLSLTDSGGIIYIGLNALADKTVASAIGSMILSDMAAVAAMRYNMRDKDRNASSPIYLMVDEAAQVVNDPYIQILNMAGGAGFINIAATQTVPDFTARLGSEDKARVMLGNFNNLFALRSKDLTTQEFITETFGSSYVKVMQTTQATSSTTEKSIAHFGGNIGERITETLEEVFPPDLMGKMPNWQYIASISGGRIVKGRVPILVSENG